MSYLEAQKPGGPRRGGGNSPEAHSTALAGRGEERRWGEQELIYCDCACDIRAAELLGLAHPCQGRVQQLRRPVSLSSSGLRRGMRQTFRVAGAHVAICFWGLQASQSGASLVPWVAEHLPHSKLWGPQQALPGTKLRLQVSPL
ncbi:hypothetical protein P7K49_010438, partial [Saguinus oedipus]